MPKFAKKLSPLEWEIMNIIWQQNKDVSVREVLSIAYPGGEKAYTTVQTVMNNLEGKGFLQKVKIGLVNFYNPQQKRDKIIKSETSGFVDRVYNGSFRALANHIVDSDSLTLDEIENLKQLIKQKEDELKGK